MAYLWCGVSEGDSKPFADLYFSHPDKLIELVGESLATVPPSHIAQVWVPVDFEDWDYVPDNY